jgi:hypothetical protein
LKSEEDLPSVNPEDYRHVFRDVVFGKNGEPGLIQKAGLSVPKFAELSNSKAPNIYAYKSGARFPTRVKAMEMAEALDIPFDDFGKMIVMRLRQSYCPDLFVNGIRRKAVKRARYERQQEHNYTLRQGGVFYGTNLPPLGK